MVGAAPDKHVPGPRSDPQFQDGSKSKIIPPKTRKLGKKNKKMNKIKHIHTGSNTYLGAQKC